VNVLVTGAFGCVGTGLVDELMRRILLVYPQFARNNLLNYENMALLYPGCRAVMPRHLANRMGKITTILGRMYFCTDLKALLGMVKVLRS
jgi:hypothetical protein